jgi:hypothetical protein
MINLTQTTTPAEAMEQFYHLAETLRAGGLPENDLFVLERIWLQRRDIPAPLYHYVRAAFIAGFTGQPLPELGEAA